MKINYFILGGIILLVTYYCISQYAISKQKSLLYEVESKAFYLNIKRYQVQIDSISEHSKDLDKKNDSIVRFIDVVEQKRKRDFLTYQKKLDELSKINTHALRQHYADSLESTMR